MKIGWDNDQLMFGITFQELKNMEGLKTSICSLLFFIVATTSLEIKSQHIREKQYVNIQTALENSSSFVQKVMHQISDLRFTKLIATKIKNAYYEYAINCF